MCNDHTYYIHNGNCIHCPTRGGGFAAAAFGILFLFVSIFCFILWLRKWLIAHYKSASELDTIAGRIGAISKVKLLLGYYQVVIAMPEARARDSNEGATRTCRVRLACEAPFPWGVVPCRSGIRLFGGDWPVDGPVDLGLAC